MMDATLFNSLALAQTKTTWHVVAVMSLLLSSIVNHAHCAISNPNDKPNCTIKVDKCKPLQSTVCLGTTLPYQMTSSFLVSDQEDHLNISGKLHLWRGLQNVPKCWDVVQPLICAVYAPKCVTDNTTNISRVHLPARELCDKTREPCRIVEKYNGWPNFLKCDSSVYVPGCTNDVMTARFNTTGNCEPPLVATTNAKSWYPDIEGCGIQCQNPMYTDEEHKQVHAFIAITGATCLACTLFTIVTFLLEWKVMSRYPGVIVFFINSCFFIGSVGWMAQFIPGARKDIVCRADGTMRKAEPQIGSGENSTCTVVFIVIYYFLMAGVTWFVILTYALNLTYGALGSTRDVLEGRRGHFHLLAWSLPLVLTIVCLALSQVDGDSVSGICFVGFVGDAYRGGFVLLPIGLSVIVGLTFLIKGLIMLVRIKTQSPGLINDEASARIRDTIIRLGIFAVFVLSFTIITFAIHTYIFLNETDWHRSLDEFIACKSNITSYDQLGSVNPETCVMKKRPSVISAQIHIFAYFAAGIIMSSWVWNFTAVKSWKRNLKKLFCVEDMTAADANAVDPPRKSELLPNLFVIQKELNQTRQSLSFNSNRDDPLAMNLDLTSVTSRELSSSWVPAVQRMMLSRSGRQRRYSDSDVQSISSLFEQIFSHDAQSRHMRSSQGTPQNDAASVLNTSHASATNKRKRHVSRKKNRVGPTTESLSAILHRQECKSGERSILGAESSGFASALPGCGSGAFSSSFTARSSFSGGSSVMARSSTAGGSCSTAGGSSLACGTSNSFQGSDACAESPASESEESQKGEERDSDACQEAHDETVLGEKVTKQASEPELVPQVLSESFNDEPEANEEYEEEDDDDDDEDCGEEENCLSRTPSDFTIASSDTEALSIKLDNDYQPVEPELQSDPPELKAVPPSTNVIKVSPIKPVIGFQRKELYDPLLPDTGISPNGKSTLPGHMMHNSTQTSGSLPPFPNLGPHSPYSIFNYGPYMPPPPPMFCIPNAETPIWPPFGYPPYFYPPFFEPRPYFPFPPSYYSQFTPPPAPYDLINPNQMNQGRTGVPTDGQVVPSDPPSRTASQQTESSGSKISKPHWFGGTSTTAFRLPSESKHRENNYGERYGKSLLEMVELMTPQLDSGTEPSDSDSTPKQCEIDEKLEERRKCKRRQRRRWLKTLAVDDSKDFSDTSL